MANEEEQKNFDLVDDFDQDDEEFEINDYSEYNKDDEEFDIIVGELQEIVISEEFEKLYKKFLIDNCEVFEDEEENKMEYMIIFKNYEKIIDGFIQQELEKRIEGFQMNRFLELLKERHSQIDEQILDTLLSFTDFNSFKQLMLDYKKQYLEEQRIEKLKTIKSSRKTLEKANKIQPTNIFSTSSNKNDPLAGLKNFAQKELPKNKKQASQDIDPDQINDDDLRPSFFIDCKQLQTPKVNNKKK
ncbi:hypothetical protein ABPG72_012967 [Tetrahymena utriculariae]